MIRILHQIPTGYQRTMVDLTQEGLEAWEVDLVRKDNHSGELSLTIGSDNPEFDGICTKRSELIVMDDEREIWRGRVVSQQLVKHWQKKLACRGLMDYLYDAVIHPQIFEGAATTVVQKLFEAFNASDIEAHKHFTVGSVVGIGEISYEVKKPTKCFDVLSALVKDYGGSLKAYRDGDVNKLDWRAEGIGYRPTCSQKAVFGENVSKLDILIDGDDLATVLYGCGKDDLMCRVEDSEAIAQFGVCEDVVSFSDVADGTTLRQKTQAELEARIKQVRTLTANAVDLSSLDPSVEPYEEGCYVQLVSEPHGVDEVVLIEEIRQPLFRKAQAQITLGASLATASAIMRRSL